ncbi:hypothetical protein, partial [Peribacillus tepidiphilus]|uniref:hypothetical protein n=1 Tax=Peribacillus tepidiphilus TaxID=2652445 RepID=UPI0035B4FBBB
KKQGSPIVKRSVSPIQQPATNLYMGHKTNPNQSVQVGGAYKRPKSKSGDCGCGGRPKQRGRQANK